LKEATVRLHRFPVPSKDASQENPQTVKRSGDTARSNGLAEVAAAGQLDGRHIVQRGIAEQFVRAHAEAQILRGRDTHQAFGGEPMPRRLAIVAAFIFCITFPRCAFTVISRCRVIADLFVQHPGEGDAAALNRIPDCWPLARFSRSKGKIGTPTRMLTSKWAL